MEGIFPIVVVVVMILLGLLRKKQPTETLPEQTPEESPWEEMLREFRAEMERNTPEESTPTKPTSSAPQSTPYSDEQSTVEPFSVPFSYEDTTEDLVGGEPLVASESTPAMDRMDSESSDSAPLKSPSLTTENSQEELFGDSEQLRKAVLYAEILKPKF